MSRVEITFDGSARGALAAARETKTAIGSVASESKVASRELAVTERNLGRTVRGAIAGSGAFRGLGRSIAFSSAAFLGGAGLLAVTKAAITQATDLAVAVDESSTVFGRNGKAVQSWAGGLVQNFGLARGEALKMANDVGLMLKGVGVAPGQTAAWSKSIVELAANIGALRHTDPAAFIQAFDQAVAGRTRGLKSYGIFIDDTRIKAEALSLGLVHASVDAGKLTDAQLGVAIAQTKLAEAQRKYGAHSVSAATAQRQLTKAEAALSAVIAGKVGNLTAAQRAQAIYALTVKSSGDATDYFAKHSDRADLAQKRLHAAIHNVEEEAGKALLPTIAHVSGAMADWLSKSENQEKVTHAVSVVTRDLTAAVKTAVPIIETAWHVADHVADAVGGWKHLLELLLALKVVSTVSKWNAAIAGQGGLLPNLRLMTKNPWVVRVSLVLLGLDLLYQAFKLIRDTSAASAAAQAGFVGKDQNFNLGTIRKGPAALRGKEVVVGPQGYGIVTGTTADGYQQLKIITAQQAAKLLGVTVTALTNRIIAQAQAHSAGVQAGPAGGSLGSPIRGNISTGRVDMGVDYSGSGYILAVADGKVTWLGHVTTSGHGGNGPFMIYDIGGGRYVYVAENWTPLVKVGDRVTKGQPIGRMTGGGVEMGWAAGPTGNWNTRALAPGGGGYKEGQRTAEGKDFLAATTGGASQLPGNMGPHIPTAAKRAAAPGGGGGKGGGKATYGFAALQALWVGAGGPAHVSKIMAAIALAETGGTGASDSVGGPNRNGTYDYGCWQINSAHGFDTAELLAPDQRYNAKCAVAVYNSQGLTAWSTYNNRSYEKYMKGGGVNPDTHVSRTDITKIPGPLHLQIAQLQRTPGPKTDIAAGNLELAFYLKQQKKKGLTANERADLQDAINETRAKIRDAQKQLANATNEELKRQSERTRRQFEAHPELALNFTGLIATGHGGSLPGLQAAIRKVRAQIAAAIKTATAGRQDAVDVLGTLMGFDPSTTVTITDRLGRSIETTIGAIAARVQRAVDLWTRALDAASTAKTPAAYRAAMKLVKAAAAAWASLGPSISAAIQAGTDAAQAALDKATATFETAFQRLSGRILTAFDRETSQHLQGMQEAEAAAEDQLRSEYERRASALQAAADARIKRLQENMNKQIAALERKRAALTPGESALASFDAQQAAEQRAQAYADANLIADPVERAKRIHELQLEDQRAALQAQAEQERKALDESVQKQEDALHEKEQAQEDSIQKQLAAQQAALQTELDGRLKVMAAEEAAREQDYQDARDALRQSLEDDLAQWQGWLEDGSKTWDDFIKWLQGKGASGIFGKNLPDPVAAMAAAGHKQGSAFADAYIAELQRAADAQAALTGIPAPNLSGVKITGAHGTSTNAHPGGPGGIPQFALGGKVPGRYVGREDTILARVTPGEHFSGRKLTRAMEDYFMGGAARGDVHLHVSGQFYGMTQRQAERALAEAIAPLLPKTTGIRTVL